MTHFPRSSGQIILFILSLMGIVIAIYLTIVHYNTHVTLVCSSSGLVNCEQVLSSSYASIPGTSIPVSIAGILWSMIAAGLAVTAWLVWPEKHIMRIAELAWGAIGILTVFYLIYVEIVLLHAICAWCTAVHIITLLYLLITVFLVSTSTDEKEADAERGQPEVGTKPKSIEID
ncbi:MAG TPA: vitamin K epoxide reductase family protein [Ktedonobacteraceae bacterium]